MLRLVSRAAKPLATFTRSLSRLSQDNGLNPFIKFGEGYPNVGLLKVNGESLGSCVLISENVALTASHCIDNDWWDKNTELQTVFNKNNHAKVNKVFKHPGFESGTLSTVNNDLAVLVLDKKLDTKPARVYSEKITYANDCAVVGFPGSFTSHAGVLDELSDIKLGFKASCYAEPFRDTYYPNILEYRVGFKINPETTKLQKTVEPLHQVSSHPGMSGGGVFKGKKLIGLVKGTMSYPPTHNLYVSMGHHIPWLHTMVRYHVCPNPTITQSESKKLENLFKTKIDPACQIFISENEIKLILPKTERLRCAELLLNNGFTPSYQPPHKLFNHDTFILIGETSSSAIGKLSNMPDFKWEDSYQLTVGPLFC